MIYYNRSIHYFYTRSKGIVKRSTFNTHKQDEELILFVGLLTKQHSILGGTTRKQVKPKFARTIEMALIDAPKKYEKIPVGTVMVEVSKSEFENLMKLSEKDDVDSLLLYSLDTPAT